MSGQCEESNNSRTYFLCWEKLPSMPTEKVNRTLIFLNEFIFMLVSLVGSQPFTCMEHRSTQQKHIYL